MNNSRRNPFIIFPILVMLIGGSLTAANGQRLKPGPQVLSFFSSVDETDQPYAVYIPENFDESRAYPLVVFLHGALSNHRLGLRRVFGQGNIQGEDFTNPGFVPEETDLEATRYFPTLKKVDYIVAAPYARGTAGYQGIPERDVYEMIVDLKNRFLIDEDRIYLTGLSMGGGGTLWLGLSRPDLWAGIASVCPAAPPGTAELAGNALNVPVHLFAGDKDFLYKSALEWKSLFEANQTRIDYVQYPGIGHNSWEYAYKDGYIFEWFSQFKREKFPERVRFSTTKYKYSKAYWVTIDELTPGALASVDVSFAGENTIRAATTAVGAITFRLEGHPQFNADRDVKVEIDGKKFNVRTAGALSFSHRDGQWVNKKYAPDLYSKRIGAEGPIAEALDGNHIYVYGTGDNPPAEDQQTRNSRASLAADWAKDRGMTGRVMVFPRVVADSAVRPSDLKVSNLVLFGTRETNLIIEKFSDLLPMHLSPEATGYGLIFIFPLNDRYVLVNSGLPWWTPRAEDTDAELTGFRMNTKADQLADFPDFILFKGTPDQIISQGRFDNNWKLPAEEAYRMEASGVVTLKAQ